MPKIAKDLNDCFKALDSKIRIKPACRIAKSYLAISDVNKISENIMEIHFQPVFSFVQALKIIRELTRTAAEVDAVNLGWRSSHLKTTLIKINFDRPSGCRYTALVAAVILCKDVGRRPDNFRL